MRLRECLLVAATAAVVAGFLLPAATLIGTPLRYSLADSAVGRTVDVQVHHTYVILPRGTPTWVSRALAAALVAALAFLLARRPASALVSTALATACGLWLLVALESAPAAGLRAETSGSWSVYPPLSLYTPPAPVLVAERGAAAWTCLGTGLLLLAAAGALTRRTASRP